MSSVTGSVNRVIGSSLVVGSGVVGFVTVFWSAGTVSLAAVSVGLVSSGWSSSCGCWSSCSSWSPARMASASVIPPLLGVSSSCVGVGLSAGVDSFVGGAIPLGGGGRRWIGVAVVSVGVLVGGEVELLWWIMLVCVTFTWPFPLIWIPVLVVCISVLVAVTCGVTCGLVAVVAAVVEGAVLVTLFAGDVVLVGGRVV